MIYFIRAPHGHIKIGLSNDPLRRLKALQTGYSEPLELLGWISGGQRLERELHLKFGHLRLLGEWFSDGPDLSAYIFNETKPPSALPLKIKEPASLEQMEAKITQLRQRLVHTEVVPTPHGTMSKRDRGKLGGMASAAARIRKRLRG